MSHVPQGGLREQKISPSGPQKAQSGESVSRDAEGLNLQFLRAQDGHPAPVRSSHLLEKQPPWKKQTRPAPRPGGGPLGPSKCCHGQRFDMERLWVRVDDVNVEVPPGVSVSMRQADTEGVPGRPS
jgi:hypothetical protein